MDAEPATQQPCTHCGKCAEACPDRLDPETLFFALARDDFDAARTERLDACRECNLCVEVCPSHIPLLDWLRWGKAEVAFRAQAEATRQRFVNRSQRLGRDRAGLSARTAPGQGARTAASAPPSVQTISRADVLAAIARGRQRKARTHDA